MIPASYLFKSVYHQHWEEPDPAPRAPRGLGFFSGLMTPFGGVLEAVLSARSLTSRHHRGGHAYE